MTDVHTGPAPTATRLADGRELFYFDDRPGPPRELHDRRELPPYEPRSELRYDRVLDEWVIIAGHRQTRTHLPPSDECPLCPSTLDRATEVPASDYDVVVFQNRFPSLGGEGAAGRCEVVSFTSDHRATFPTLPVDRRRTVGRAWIERTAALRAEPKVEYVFCFENSGTEIGVTLQHPHGQIYAYPFLPPRVRRSLESAATWRQRTGRCLFCSMVSDELAAGDRVVARTEHAVAFVPVAARWPLEVHVHPLRHVADLADLDAVELDEMLALYADVIARFHAVFGVPAPYIAAWQQAPTRTGRDLAHLHLQAFSSKRAADRLKFLAGSEAAAGVFVNDIPPERAAQLLRAART